MPKPGAKVCSGACDEPLLSKENTMCTDATLAKVASLSPWCDGGWHSFPALFLLLPATSGWQCFPTQITP